MMCYKKNQTRNCGTSISNKVNLSTHVEDKTQAYEWLWVNGCLWLVWSELEVVATAALYSRVTIQEVSSGV